MIMATVELNSLVSMSISVNICKNGLCPVELPITLPLGGKFGPAAQDRVLQPH